MRASAYLRLALLLICLVLSLPLYLVIIGNRAIDKNDPTHVAIADLFFHIFFRFEPPALVLTIAALLGAFWWLCRRGTIAAAEGPKRPPPRTWAVPAIAAAVFVMQIAGNILVFHSYRLVCDEYLMEWQAITLAHGQRDVPLPEEFRPYAYPLLPWQASLDPVRVAWGSPTLPLYAALSLPFYLMGLDMVFNPLLSALAVLLVAAAARRLWPEEPAAPLLAALLMASGAQFLISGMSYFSSSAYLFFNLLWLLLYLRNGKGDAMLLPWVGVIALGLHQPFYHALFVLPFLLRIVRTRSLGWTAYTAAVYLLGCGAVLAWYAGSIHPAPELPDVGPTARVTASFAFPSAEHLLLDYASWTLLLTWQNPAALVLALVALWRARLTPVLWDLAWGLFLTLLFYMFLVVGPAMTWGYRFCHPVLGNLALLGVAGAFALRDDCGALTVRRLVGGFTVFAVAVMLPLRAWQAESFVRPSAEATRWLQSHPEDVVVIEAHKLLISVDLPRNSPYLTNRPLMVWAERLKPGQLDELRQRHSVRVVKAKELLRFGMLSTAPPEDGVTPESRSGDR